MYKPPVSQTPPESFPGEDGGSADPTWQQYYRSLPHPSTDLAQTLRRRHPPASLPSLVAQAQLQAEGMTMAPMPAAQCHEAMRWIARALDHPQIDTPLRLFLLRLAANLDFSQQPGPEIGARIALIRQLTTDDMNPAFRLIAPRAELRWSLNQRNVAAIERIIEEGWAICRPHPESDQALEWLVHHFGVAVERKHFWEADRMLANLEAQHQRVTERIGFDLTYGKINLLLSKGLGDEAIAALDEAGMRDDDTRRVYAHLLSGHITAVRQLINRFHAGAPYGQFYRGLLGLAEQDYGLVRDCVRRLRQHSPPRTAAWDWRGEDLLALHLSLNRKRCDEAHYLLSHMDPGADFGDCHGEWMRYYYHRGQFSEAHHHWQQLQRRGPHLVKQSLAWASDLGAVDLARIMEPNLSNEVKTKQPSLTGNQTRTLIGSSTEMNEARRLLDRFAPRPETVLLIGETGCGKEIAARILHRQGCPRGAPFIAVNCAALTESLAEAELFGHVRGAFTGANRSAPGLIHQARGGVLFLDEIASTSPRIQGMLLRLLETGDYRPIGSSQTQNLEARIIAATHCDLEELCLQGQFRQDLQFRLQRLTIQLPPLREHRQDISELATHFIHQFGLQRPPIIGDDLLAAWLDYAWPGNARELRNEIEGMLVLYGDEEVLHRRHSGIFRSRVSSARLPVVTPRRPSVPANSPPVPPGGRKVLQRREQILAMLRRDGRITRAMIIHELGCAPNTATADLKELEDQGLIQRQVQGANLRLSSFILSPAPPSDERLRKPL
ncbi:MAG: sigma-54-dependent Fis family transcriptional regulator [Planctomycetota bacterium]|nr:MAG: sigma-54-dependent Fis family transcriptional regulator [Planctomycetota bacterium]